MCFGSCVKHNDSACGLLRVVPQVGIRISTSFGCAKLATLGLVCHDAKTWVQETLKQADHTNGSLLSTDQPLAGDPAADLL